MADKVWKQAERRVAALFGCRRRRGSGCDPETGSDDILHPTVFVEVRYRRRHAVLGWWDQDVESPAARENKFPVLALVEKRRSKVFAVVPLNPWYLRALADHLEHRQEPNVPGPAIPLT